MSEENTSYSSDSESTGGSMPRCILTLCHQVHTARQTAVCTGVAECEGDDPRSDDEEIDLVDASRWSSSTLF